MNKLLEENNFSDEAIEEMFHELCEEEESLHKYNCYLLRLSISEDDDAKGQFRSRTRRRGRGSRIAKISISDK